MGKETVTLPTKPLAWAGRLTQVMNLTLGTTADRFPVAVKPLALDYSRHVFRDEPLVRVDGEHLGRFEGCLKRLPDEGGWGILHNTGVSPGRARFTLAHEFGHYLMHRQLAGKDGLSCTSDDIAMGAVGGRDIEKEANAFAAALLMPLDDFRKQSAPKSAVDLHMLSTCAERYGTSLIATTLKWLSYTERRAVLVMATEGFVLWAVSSEPALKSGAYLRTKGMPPIEVHPASLLSTGTEDRSGIAQGPDVWFHEECREMTLIPDGYDFGMSLILLGDAPDRRWDLDDEEGDAVAQAVDVRTHSQRS